MTGNYTEWHFTLFSEQYKILENRLFFLASEFPDTFHTHEDVKFFKRIRTSMDKCLEYPEANEYALGDTLARQKYDGKLLGKNYSNWRRIKNNMPPRYRLFFVFSSGERIVIFSWLNDGSSLRREGHKSDVYAVFAKLIAGGKIPSLFSALQQESNPMP
ncbi:MAG: type II toxin-antitoxin system YhaV family toxin [Tannerella sp.]|jgi:toxin YhaV|nr:type II toxin-antitoxin system YhaV family toxin [Tannerella sp.]